MFLTPWLRGLKRSLASSPRRRGRRSRRSARRFQRRLGFRFPIVAELLEDRTLLTTFTVNSFLDTVDVSPGNGVAQDGAGNTTLRAAIQEANALAGDDTINLPAGTYTLTIAGAGENAAATGDLDITQNLTITGAGAGVTIIDADALDRVLHVLTGVNLNLSGVSVVNGTATGGYGGGLYKQGSGTVGISASRFADNSADYGGAIYSEGDVTITNTTLLNNTANLSGGAIHHNVGAMTLVGSTLSGNTAVQLGGGIYNTGNVTLTNSTLSGNLANGPTGSGGAISAQNAPVTITNSTISANYATQYAGGVHTGGGAAIITTKNTIIAGNTAGITSPDVTGTLNYVSQGNNLIGELGTFQPPSGYVNGVNGDLVGTGGSPLNPLLGPLGDNGGPTLTHSLFPGSPAIDAGNNVGTPATDQRGVTRPQDGNGDSTATLDIGAFEFEPNIAPVLMDTVLLTVERKDVTDNDNLGESVNDLIGGITDANTVSARGIAVTRTNETHGTVQYSTDGGTNWLNAGLVSNSNALLLAADGQTRVRMRPASGFTGSVVDAITFRAWDRTTGAAATKVDASTNGGSTAFSSATDTLEIVFTIGYWDGGGADANWSTAGNWGEDIVPSPGDHLVFPQGAARLTNINDFAATTNFASITYGGSGYDISGNSISLGSGGITSRQTGGTNTLRLDLLLATTSMISASGMGTSLELTGVMSGNGGLTKTGAGTLVLSGTTVNTFTGRTTVRSGELHLNKTIHQSALSGDLVVGDEDGTAVVRWMAADQVDDLAAVTVNRDGKLFLTTGAFAQNERFKGIAGAGEIIFGTGNGQDLLTIIANGSTFTGTMTGADANDQFNIQGPSTITLSSATGFAGQVIATSGTLAIGHDEGLGTGTLLLYSGVVQASGGPRTVSNAVELHNDFASQFAIAGSSDLTFSGIFQLTNESNGTLNVTNTGMTTLSGTVTQASSARGIVKTGSGTLVVSGSVTYTGATTVNEGALILDGTLSVGTGATTVNTGGTVGGSGQVRALSISGGTLSPGNASAGTGILGSGSTTLDSGSTLSVNLNGTTAGTSYDRLAVQGTVDLGSSTLQVSLGYTPVAATTFVIIDNDGADAIVNTFAGLSEGALLSAGGSAFQISYVGGDGNDVVLTSPPDLGDAPSPYPTTLAENGARHSSTGPMLGVSRDGESDGTHSTAANADDTTGTPDDEDGVTFNSSIRVGVSDASVTVNVQNAPSGAKLDAWIDFNRDGDWSDLGERIANSVAVVNGDNQITFNVPAGAQAGTTYARFRLSTAGNLAVTGLAPDGEVEDHLLTIQAQSARTSLFGGQNNISTSADAAILVYAADVDGDGDMDVLSASSNDDKIAWYQNDGSGNFTSYTITTSADGAYGVFAADVDGDGDMDALSASWYDDKIAWYENDGNENFTAHTISTAADGGYSVFAADVDGDGDMDALSASWYDAKIAWYENDGSENFTAHTISTAAGEARRVFAADLDRDGDMDVLSASNSGNKLAWYENDGSENFTDHTISSAIDGGTSVFVADVDGDGDMDVLSASCNDDRIAWYENDGSQNFTAHTISTTADYALSVYAADLDADGDTDVLSASIFDSKVAWYENDGSESFAAHTITTSAAGVRSVLAADIDGDGDLDVVIGSESDDKVAWYANLNSVPTHIGLNNSSVAENQASGTVVGTFSSTDADMGDTHTYSLVAGSGDGDNASFTIVGDQLRTNAVFDYETKNSYSIRVRTTDAAGLWYEKALAIAVSDVAANWTIDPAAWSSGELTLVRSGNLVHLYQTDTTTDVVAPWDVADLTGISITGRNDANDTLTVDFTGGALLPAAGITFDGGSGTGNDGLRLIGNGGTIAVYTPHATTVGNGTITVDGEPINFLGLGPVDISGMSVATVSLPGANDVVTVQTGTDFHAGGTNPALRISGSSGGTNFETVALWNNTSLVIDTCDLVDGNDSVTFSSADNAHGNTNLLVTTGVGTDSLTVNGAVSAAGRLSISSGTIAVNADIVAGGDVVLDAGGASSDLNLNANVTAGQEAHLRAGRSIFQVSGTNYVTADTVALEASGSIGADANAGAVDMRVNTVAAQANGHIWLNQDSAAGPLTVGQANNLLTGAGTIDGVVVAGGTGGSVTLTTEDDDLIVSQAVASAGGSPVTITVNDLNAGDGVEKVFTLTDAAAAAITAPGNGAITITADNMTLGGTAGTIGSGASEVTLQPLEAGTRIDLGGDGVDTSGYLILADAELDALNNTAGVTNIGRLTVDGHQMWIVSDFSVMGDSDTLHLWSGNTVAAWPWLSDGGDIIANKLAITCGGAVVVETQVNTVAATTPHVWLYIDEQSAGGALVVGTVDGVSGATGGDEIQVVALAGTITIDQPITSTGGSTGMLIQANGGSSDVVVNADVTTTASDLRVGAGRDLTTDGTGRLISTAGGGLRIGVGNAVGTSAQPIDIDVPRVAGASGSGMFLNQIDGINKDLRISWAGGYNGFYRPSSLALTVQAGSLTVAERTITDGGPIDLRASADVKIDGGFIQSGNGAIQVIAGGSITTNTATNTTTELITSGTALLQAVNAIGAGENHIDTDVGTLAARITGSSTTGDIFINQVDGLRDALTIGTATGLNGQLNLTGITAANNNDITVVAQNGTLTVAQPLDAGSITLSANNVAVNQTITATNTVTLQPYTSSVAINLGGADNPTTPVLGLSNTEFQKITAATVQIGSASAGDITVSDNIQKPNNGIDETLLLKTPGSIVVNSYKAITSAGNKLSVTFNADADASGGGAIVMDVLSAITTSGGDITFGGGADPAANPAVGTAGHKYGIDLAAANTLNAGAGNIGLRGRGYSAAGVDYLMGVHFDTNDLIQTTSGAIAIDGTGGTGAAMAFGVWVYGTTIRSSTGSISITGRGGAGTGAENSGMYVTASTIESTDSATIAIHGTGGTGDVLSAGVELMGSHTVQSVNGNIQITGQGGTLGRNEWGVYLGGGNVQSTGNAQIAIHATGGTGDLSNFGLFMTTAETITSAAGDISITATGGSGGGDSHGLVMRTGGLIESTGSAAVTIDATAADGTGVVLGDTTAATLGSATATGTLQVTTDTIMLANSSVVQGIGQLLLEPKNASTTIGLGDAAAGTFNLDATELGMIADGFAGITIGRVSDGTGAVDVNASTFNDNLTIAGGSIAVTGLNAGSNSVTLTARNGSITDGDNSTTNDVTASSLTLSAASGIGASGANATLETTVGKVQADGGSGGVFVDNTGALTVGGFPPEFGFALGAGGTGDDVGRAVATDGAGNVYVAGWFQGTTDFDPGPGVSNLTSAGGDDIFAAKYSASGALIWARGLGGATNDHSYGVAVAADGSVYTTGSYAGTVDFDPGAGTFNLTSTAGLYDAFVSKLDSGGNFVWARGLGGTNTEEAYGIAVSADGNVYTTGYFSGTADFDPGAGTSNLSSTGNADIFVSKLDAAGNFAWARSLGGTSDDFSYGIDVAADGSVYTTGYFQDTADFDPGAGAFNLTSAGDRDVFVSKLDAAGNFAWARGLGGTNTEEAYAIAVTADGNAYTTGYFSGTADFDPGAGTFDLSSVGSADDFVSQLDAAGNFVWARSLAGPTNEMGYGIALAGDGSVYTTGFFGGTADFDPGAGTFNLTSAGAGDVFVSQLDSAGNFVWAGGLGGSNWDWGNGIAVGADGGVYTTGFFRATADLDPGAGTYHLASGGSNDIFVSRLEQTGISAQGGIGITSSGLLTIAAPIVASGGGNISLASGGTAADDLALHARVAASGGNGNVTLQTGHDLLVTDSGPNDISVAGTGSITATAAGSLVLNTRVDVASAGGTITLNADAMAIDTSAAPASINVGAGIVTLRNVSSSQPINLGTATGGLDLTDGELDRVTAGTLRIGRNDGTAAGAIDVGSAVNPANATNLHLLTGSTVGGAGAITTVTGLAINAGGAITLTNANEVDNLALKTTAGNISYTDSDGFTVASVDGVNGVDTDSGSVALVATTGNVTVQNADGGAAGAVNDLEATTTVDVTLSADNALFTVNTNATLASAGGTHTYTADKISLDGTIAATGQRVILKSATAGDTIDLGRVTDANNTALELSSAELGRVTATTLEIGTASSGGGSGFHSMCGPATSPICT